MGVCVCLCVRVCVCSGEPFSGEDEQPVVHVNHLRAVFGLTGTNNTDWFNENMKQAGETLTSRR